MADGRADLLHRIPQSVSSDPNTQRVVLWAVTAASAFAVGTTVWWLSREKYYSYVPPQVRSAAAAAASTCVRPALRWWRGCGRRVCSSSRGRRGHCPRRRGTRQQAPAARLTAAASVSTGISCCRVPGACCCWRARKIACWRGCTECTSVLSQGCPQGCPGRVSVPHGVDGRACCWLTPQHTGLLVALAVMQYQYRPGMFTGWMAGLLAQHAKRRRRRRPIRVYMDGEV